MRIGFKKYSNVTYLGLGNHTHREKKSLWSARWAFGVRQDRSALEYVWFRPLGHRIVQ